MSSVATGQGVDFEELLARCDEADIGLLVGEHAVRLLRTLDLKLGLPSSLQRLCLKLHSPESILRNRETRGRLLLSLRPEEANSLASLLGLNSHRPSEVYKLLEEVSIRKNSSKERKLFDFFELEIKEPETTIQAPAIKCIKPKYSLFDHQYQAMIDVLEKLSSTERRVVLHMPTGAGKTRTAMHIASSVLLRKKPSVAIWLAYSEELCEQASEEFEEAWSYLGDRDLNIYRFWGNERDLSIDDLRDGFLVAGLSKLFERAKRDSDFITRLADRTSLVIIDEAHQAIADTYSFLLDYLVHRNDFAGLLGLTATPGRTLDDPEEDERLAAFFNHNKVTLNAQGYDSPVDYLIAEGYLAKPIFHSLPYSLGKQLSDRQIRGLARVLDIPESILNSLSEDVQRNMLIVNIVEELANRHERILVFGATVQHSKLLATVLQARGLRAGAISHKTGLDERQRLIDEYKYSNGDPMILCNYGVLTTGFDAPRTSAEVIARPTKSLVLYSQMVGRATRGILAGGNAEAEIFTIVDTQLPGFGNMVEAFNNWEDVWTSNSKTTSEFN